MVLFPQLIDGGYAFRGRAAKPVFHIALRGSAVM